MKFRLIYDGPLQPSQRDPENGGEDPIRLHNHNIRKIFHGQLKRLWQTNQFLAEYRTSRGTYMKMPTNSDTIMELLSEIIPDLHRVGNYRCLPLVREDWSLLCALDILFLRRDNQEVSFRLAI
jgi:hypothetical protein